LNMVDTSSASMSFTVSPPEGRKLIRFFTLWCSTKVRYLSSVMMHTCQPSRLAICWARAMKGCTSPRVPASGDGWKRGHG
jgi:hypothetical protein